MRRKPKVRVTSGGYLSGFHYACAKLLKKTSHGQRPTPDSVRKVISDKQPSRTMILNIFRNAPQILQSRSTSPFVKQLYNDFFMTGNLNPKYGKHGTSAFECRRRHTNAA